MPALGSHFISLSPPPNPKQRTPLTSSKYSLLTSPNTYYEWCPTTNDTPSAPVPIDRRGRGTRPNTKRVQIRMNNPSRVRKVRKSMARIQVVMGERRRAIQAAAEEGMAEADELQAAAAAEGGEHQ